jgi:hypothetical protein
VSPSVELAALRCETTALTGLGDTGIELDATAAKVKVHHRRAINSDATSPTVSRGPIYVIS